MAPFLPADRTYLLTGAIVTMALDLDIRIKGAEVPSWNHLLKEPPNRFNCQGRSGFRETEGCSRNAKLRCLIRVTEMISSIKITDC